MSTLTTLDRSYVAKCWSDFVLLDGKKTSEMDEYELRLVDFFTKRDTQGNITVRKATAYVKQLLEYLDVTSMEGFKWKDSPIIVEDKEVYFPPVPIETILAMDTSMKSITAVDYKPLRYFRTSGTTFRRISKRNKVYMEKHPSLGNPFYTNEVKANSFMADEIHFIDGSRLDSIGVKLTSQLSEDQLKDLLKAGGEYIGDYLVAGDTKILSDTFIYRTTEHLAPYMAKVQAAVLLAMWSNMNVTAPTYVLEAMAAIPDDFRQIDSDGDLLALDATGDAELAGILNYIKATLGKYNRNPLIIPRKKSGNAKSAAISILMNNMRKLEGGTFINPKPAKSHAGAPPTGPQDL